MEYKIMIIDDEQGIIDSIQALLNRNGYWCIGYTDPLAGLDELMNSHYDLLVLDYFMQPIHGKQSSSVSAQRLRALYTAADGLQGSCASDKQ